MRQRLRESLAAFRSVFENPNLRRVELAWTGSETGKWMYSVALAVFAYASGGAAAVGLVAVIRIVPAAILAPFAAVLSDRYRRERVMLLADVSRAALMGAAAAAVALDLPAGVVYAIAGVVTILSTTFRPAQSALLPSISRTPEELTAANVTMQTIASIGSFAGPAIGGLVLAVSTVEVVFVCTAATFLLSAFWVLGIRGGAPPGARREEESRLLADAAAGFRTILAEPRLRLIVGLYGAQALIAGALGVLIVVSAIELLDLGPSGVGYLEGALGVGGVVGAALTVALVARSRLGGDFAFGLVLWGAPLILIGVFPNAAAAFFLLALIGIGETLVEIAAPTLLQRSVPDEVLARVFGAVESLLIATMGIGAVVAPPLVDSIGSRATLIATGCVLPALGILFWPRLAAVDRGFAMPEARLALLRTTPIFAPLPATTLERLATQLAEVRAAAGDTVVREGEPGDRFYLVADGRLEVSVDGSRVRELGAGDHFGEIALLRRVPRTATVRAETDADLLALERDEFIAAVTGHPPSREAADAVVATRLATARTSLAPD